MKKAIAIVAVILISVIIFRTVRFQSRQMEVSPVEKVQLDVNPAELLAGAIRFETVSQQDPAKWKPEPFVQLREYMRTMFPLTHSRLEWEQVGEHSLLYIWKGTEAGLPAVLLMAHMDVVPAEGNWKYPAFSGTIAEDHVWGRGALDDKANLIAILSAVETLLKTGITPRRSVYLAFGHDEEVTGLKGAAVIAAELGSRGVEVEFIIDEGLAIAENMVQGVSRPVALIGIAEKGYLTLELSVEGPGGHSSTPPKHSTIGILSEAIRRLEENPMPARLDGPSLETFRYLGPEMSWPMRSVLANLWLTGPLVKFQFKKEAGTAAMIRTSTAVTMVQGGIKENVLARKATATVNFRILPGDSVERVMEHVRNTVGTSGVKIMNPHGMASEPSAVSGTETEGFRILSQSIRQVFPDVLVAPSLLMGATDSRHYSQLSGNIYRFSPFRFTESDLSRVHGENECISVTDCSDMVRFYVQLIRNCCG